MLTGLSIRDIVLIDRLELELGPGLTVLTGETGAGKSIVLDALGLALGGRAGRDLLRPGAGRGLVAARFAPPSDHPVRALLAEQGLDAGEAEIVLRRELAADGKSRAFVDDTPVAGQFLRRVGEALVAVHGQHDSVGLLDPSVQRTLLDAFAGARAAAAETRAAWQARQAAEQRRRTLAEQVAQSAREAEYLRHRAQELEALAVEPGEEERLAEARQRLQARARLAAALEEASGALEGPSGAGERLALAARRLERVRTLAESALAPVLEALERARVELDEARAQLDALRSGLDAEGDRLDLEKFFRGTAFDPNGPDASSWLRFVATDFDGAGGLNDVRVEVDRDGPGSGYGFSTAFIVLNQVSTAFVNIENATTFGNA
ncbi:MAG: AAA family ATPase [Geminicoccaceae bacterium]|nr:AAA family ATPase [Geminicoccaceae bacterium]